MIGRWTEETFLLHLNSGGVITTTPFQASSKLCGNHYIYIYMHMYGDMQEEKLIIFVMEFRKMGMEYVDMYLVHWPVKLKPWACDAVPKEEDFEPLDLESTWAGMEKCLDMGLCRCIGVSNFSSKKIQRLLDFASVPPAVNQVQYSTMAILTAKQILKFH
jgi:diketogulonate reductase-like aldo/keto reductase